MLSSGHSSIKIGTKLPLIFIVLQFVHKFQISSEKLPLFNVKKIYYNKKDNVDFYGFAHLAKELFKFRCLKLH